METRQYPQRITAYFFERFNPFQMVPLSLVFGSTITLVTQSLLKQPFQLSKIPIVTSALFLFLLRLRIFDEWKDANHDKKYHPYRPVPRGLVTLHELNPLLVVCAVSEFLIAGTVPGSLPFFLFALFYSLLMAKEFFIASWLRSHFFIYIVSHEILLIPLSSYLSGLSVQTAITFPSAFTIAPLTGFIAATMFILEIGRKYHFPGEEKPGNDTYTSNFGINSATLLLISIACISYICALLLSRSIEGDLLLSGVLILFILSLLKLLNNKKSGKGKYVFLLSILFSFISHATVIASSMLYEIRI